MIQLFQHVLLQRLLSHIPHVDTTPKLGCSIADALFSLTPSGCCHSSLASPVSVLCGGHLAPALSQTTAVVSTRGLRLR
eukprot:4626763-Pleurochrysis_carterae.AAC.1